MPRGYCLLLLCFALFAIAPPTFAAGAATTFDYLYPAGWAPNSGRTPSSVPVVGSKPARETAVPSKFFTDAAYGVKGHRVTDMADVPNGYYNRHEYSRRQAYNSDSTLRLTQNTKAYWWLYNATTNQRIEGTHSNPTDGKGAIEGLGGDCEPIWHPTNPNLLWHTDPWGGLKWYERNPRTGAYSVLFDLAPLLANIPGLTDVTRAYFNGEGRPSNDGRYWGLALETDGYISRGFCMYDRQTNKILGYKLTNGARPNWVGTSPLGNYIIAAWYGTAANSLAEDETWPIERTSGVRVYTRDCTSFRTLSVLGQHSDVGLDAYGNEVLIQVSFTGDKDGVVDGSVFYRHMADPSKAYSLPLNTYNSPDNGDTGIHISATNYDRPGWAVVSRFSFAGGNPHDGAFHVVELVPTNPRIFRIAYHHTNRTEYFASPQAAPNRDLTRFIVASNWGGSIIEDYEYVLPSWAIPTAGSSSTSAPTTAPTVKPTTAPTVKPTTAPTVKPTAAPTVKPTTAPTVKPTTAPTAAPTCAASVAGSGTGLLASYYTGTTFNTLKAQRIDPFVNYNYGSNGPTGVGAFPVDSFSVQWKGTLLALHTGLHTFFGNADDGVRLYINETLVFNDWSSHSARDVNGTFYLVKGNQYPIRLAYYELSGPASVSLSWSSACIAKSVIPTSQLTPAAFPSC